MSTATIARNLTLVILMAGVLPTVRLCDASEPPTEAMWDRARQQGKEDVLREILETVSEFPGANLSDPAPMPSSIGTNHIPVLLIDFNNANGDPVMVGTYTDNNFESLLFTGTDSMADYFDEVSYQQLTVDGAAFPNTGWYRAPNTSSYYANGMGGIRDTYPKNAQGLVRDAILAADADVDFSQYDDDGDGFVDSVLVVFAGYKAGDMSDYNNRFWPHQWRLSAGQNGPGPVTVDGVQVDTYMLLHELYSPGYGVETGEQARIGTYCHEYGHVLGLPDLYTTAPSGQGYDANWGLGTFALMAYGGRGGDYSSPERPSHMCPWSKIELGWVTPTDVTSALLAETIQEAEFTDDIYRLWTNGQTTTEYFLVEYRHPAGFDQDLRSCGLVVYHVDESVKTGDFDNDGIINVFDNDLQWDETHKLIDVEAANQVGADHTIDADFLDDRTACPACPTANSASGAFFSSATNSTFDANSTPSTISYTNQPTNVSVTNVGGCSEGATSITADLDVGAIVTPNVDLWVNDCAADTGAESSTPPCYAFWKSTDIWIDNDYDGTQDQPVYNQANRLFARVHNLGTTPAMDVTVDFYFVNNSTGLNFPGAATLIGSKTIPLIAPGERVNAQVWWTIPSPPSNGHYCIGVVATNAVDGQTSEVLNKDNNVGGVNIVQLNARAGNGVPDGAGGSGLDPDGPIETDFDIENATDEDVVPRIFAEIELLPGWDVQFRDLEFGAVWGGPIGPPLVPPLPPGTTRPMRMTLFPPGEVFNSQTASVSVIQYNANQFLQPQGIMGGIDFTVRVDGHRPGAIDDLVALTVFDTPADDDPPAGELPAVRLSFTPISDDLFGGADQIAYYNVYRDTSPNVVPGPGTLIGQILSDTNPTLPGWQFFDSDVQVGPWFDRDVEYYYVVAAVDTAGYEAGFSQVAGTGNVADNGTVRAALNEFGGSGVRTQTTGSPAEIAWLDESSNTQVYSWQGNLHYDDGEGASNHLMNAESESFQVIEAAHYVNGDILSRFGNEQFEIAATHRLDGSGLISSLKITNVSGADITGVDLAWMLDADLEPDFGFGEARWFGEIGAGWQSNRSPTNDPPTIVAKHRVLMDGAPPAQWHVGNPSGWLGSTGGFDGENTSHPIYMFGQPFDQQEGPVGLDGDAAIVTNFALAVWGADETRTVEYVLRFEAAVATGDFDFDGDADLFDFQAFLDCATGPGGGLNPGCDAFDFDGDGDIDRTDFAAFQRAFTG